MSKRIFRDVALERLSTPEQLDQVMQVTRPIHWIAILSFFTLIFVAGAWSILSGASIKVSGQGILVTQQGVLEVVTTSSGRITSFTVEEGEFVQAGQVVAQIDQPDLQAELESASLELSEIRTFQERERAIQDEYLTQRKRNVLLSIEFLNQRLTWLEERLAYEEELTKKKFIGRQRPIDTQIEINTAQEALAVANNTLNEIDLQENNTRVGSELQVNSLTRRVKVLQSRLDRESVVKSPYDGTVVEFKVNVGEVVSKSASLFSVIPTELRSEGLGSRRDTDLVAILYVAPEDGKKIRLGMEAQIDPVTVKREEYGFMTGRVRQVSEIPSTPEGMMRILKNPQLVATLSGANAPFEVMVDLDPDPSTPSGFRWSSSTGPDTSINTGTLANGSMTVRKVRLISLVIPALQSLFEPEPVI